MDGGRGERKTASKKRVRSIDIYFMLHVPRKTVCHFISCLFLLRCSVFFFFILSFFCRRRPCRPCGSSGPTDQMSRQRFVIRSPRHIICYYFVVSSHAFRPVLAMSTNMVPSPTRLLHRRRNLFPIRPSGLRFFFFRHLLSPHRYHHRHRRRRRHSPTANRYFRSFQIIFIYV